VIVGDYSMVVSNLCRYIALKNLIFPVNIFTLIALYLSDSMDIVVSGMPSGVLQNLFIFIPHLCGIFLDYAIAIIHQIRQPDGF